LISSCGPSEPSSRDFSYRIIGVVPIAIGFTMMHVLATRIKDPCQDWGHLLRFLSPLTVSISPLIKMT
jgi:hypothetical protein